MNFNGSQHSFNGGCGCDVVRTVIDTDTETDSDTNTDTDTHDEGTDGKRFVR